MDYRKLSLSNTQIVNFFFCQPCFLASLSILTLSILLNYMSYTVLINDMVCCHCFTCFHIYQYTSIVCLQWVQPCLIYLNVPIKFIFYTWNNTAKSRQISKILYSNYNLVNRFLKLTFTDMCFGLFLRTTMTQNYMMRI